MKKILLFLSLISILLIGTNSCKKDDVIDPIPTDSLVSIQGEINTNTTLESSKKYLLLWGKNISRRSNNATR